MESALSSLKCDFTNVFLCFFDSPRLTATCLLGHCNIAEINNSGAHSVPIDFTLVLRLLSVGWLPVYCNNRGLEAHLTNWTTALILSAPEYTAVPRGLLVGGGFNIHLPQKDHTVKKQLQMAQRNLTNQNISTGQKCSASKKRNPRLCPHFDYSSQSAITINRQTVSYGHIGIYVSIM